MLRQLSKRSVDSAKIWLSLECRRVMVVRLHSNSQTLHGQVDWPFQADPQKSFNSYNFGRGSGFRKVEQILSSAVLCTGDVLLLLSFKLSTEWGNRDQVQRDHCKAMTY